MLKLGKPIFQQLQNGPEIYVFKGGIAKVYK